MAKQTSGRVSTLASRYMTITVEDIFDAESLTPEERTACEGLADDIRTLAASALTQDETPGQGTPLTILGRLKVEREDLDKRLGKLVDFLNAGSTEIPRRHKLMLDEQNRLMSELLAVLDERICDLEIVQRNTDEDDGA